MDLNSTISVTMKSKSLKTQLFFNILICLNLLYPYSSEVTTRVTVAKNNLVAKCRRNDQI